MLIDTSGLFSFFDPRDRHHADSITLFRDARRRVIHNYVLAEFVALANARKHNRHAALSLAADLVDNPHVEMIWVDESRHRSAIGLLQAQLDKTYSVCDAVRFLVMRERAVTAALTTDHHFEQAGFVRLLKP